MDIFHRINLVTFLSFLLQSTRISGQQQAVQTWEVAPASLPMFVMAGSDSESGGYNSACGMTRYAPGLSRIVNGNMAQYGNFPWSAALVHKSYKQYCAGTIINSDWILTAAHCVVGSLSVRDVVANATIIVGTRNLANVSQANVYQIGQVALYPGYEPTGWKNDLALIKLKRSIPNFTDEIKPACLPRRSLDDLVNATSRSTCYLPGWGYLQERPGAPIFHSPTATNAQPSSTNTLGSGSDKLLYAKLNFVPLKTCQDTYYQQALLMQGSPEYVLDSMVCAASGHLNNLAAPQGTCMGDSGGGLFCQEEDNSWVVYGIASWSGGCARKDLPSIFTNVFKLRFYVDRILAYRAGK